MYFFFFALLSTKYIIAFTSDITLPFIGSNIVFVSVYGYCCFCSHTGTHPLGKTPLDEESARRRDFNLHNIQKTHQTNIHAHIGVRIRSNSYKTLIDDTLRRNPTWSPIWKWEINTHLNIREDGGMDRIGLRSCPEGFFDISAAGIILVVTGQSVKKSVPV